MRDSRGDRWEGLDSILQPEDLGEAFFDSGLPTIGRFNINPEDLAGPIRISKNRTLACNLFCLYTLAQPVKDSLSPKGHQWFGDSLALVTNTQEFLNRVSSAAAEQRLPIKGALVEYFDENTYSGGVGRFKKSSRFAYQNEFALRLRLVSTRFSDFKWAVSMTLHRRNLLTFTFAAD